jgi:hypothetical protein
MLVLTLPNLVAGRDLADLMLDRVGPCDGEVVVVDARHTASGSASFASQLVTRTLVDGGADRLVVVGAPSRFADHLLASARERAVEGRLELAASLPAEPAGV